MVKKTNIEVCMVEMSELEPGKRFWLIQHVEIPHC